MTLRLLYHYDVNGNRTQMGNVAASYDAQDRLVNNGAITYTHNTDGDLQTKIQGGQTTQYHYDTLGNLIRVQLPSDNVEYVLDGNDRRVARKLNNVITHRWLYQGSFTPIAEINAQGEIVARYVYGSRDHVPEYIFTATAVYRLVVDQLGSVRLVVNAQTGDIVQQLSYDAWGNVLQDTSPGLQPFGFAGGMYDPQTGLVHFGAREYDPTIGRFLSKDPLGFASEDTNFYTYVYNDPVNKIDPSGLFMNFAASCIAGGGIEIVYQVAVEQRHFGCIDWTSVLWETAMGCVMLPKWTKPMRGTGRGHAPVGRKNNPLTNPPYQPTRNTDEFINGRRYTGHSLDQAQNRGLTPTVIEDAIQNGEKSADPIPGRTRNYSPDNNITVITEGDDVITVFPGKR